MEPLMLRDQFVVFRASEEERFQLRKAAAGLGYQDLSDFLRDVLREHLASDEKHQNANRVDGLMITLLAQQLIAKLDHALTHLPTRPYQNDNDCNLVHETNFAHLPRTLLALEIRTQVIRRRLRAIQQHKSSKIA
jgi:hypothetical protein